MMEDLLVDQELLRAGDTRPVPAEALRDIDLRTG
jgi:hypothetical protein